MRNRSSKRRAPKRQRPETDVNRTAFNVVAKATGMEPAKNPHAVALGKLGGKKGGPARAERLSPEERRRIASRAAQARWAKAK